jgi:hypothetical protein
VPKRKKLSQSARKRVGSKVRLALFKKKNELGQRLIQLMEHRSRLVNVITSEPVTGIITPDGSVIKARLIDPIVDRMDRDNEREIGRVQYEISKLDQLLSPPRGRAREPIYEAAFQDKNANPSLTVLELAQKYLQEYFPNRKESAVEMMRQGMRRASKRKH